MTQSITARIASVTAAVAVALSLLATVADGKVVIGSLTGKRFGVTPSAGSPAAAAARRPRSLLASPLNATCSSPCPLTFHSGGVVQHAEQVYLLFWDPGNALPSAYKSGLATWLNDLAGADYTAGDPVSVTQQYYDNTGSGGSHSYVPYAVQNAGSLTDTDAYPSSGCTVSGYSVCLTDSQIAQEVASYASAHHKPTGLGAQYYVFTPSGIDSCFDSAATQCAYSYYCGYHSDYQPLLNTDVLYADMPYVVSGQGCGDPPPLNSGDVDAVVGVFSHELSETMTDPRLDAWYDGNGDEVGDKCAYQYGSLSTTPGGLSYNVQIGSDYYYIQQEWDNRTDSCLTTDTDAQPSGSISVTTSPVLAGSPTSMSASVTDSAGVAYIQWEFGDGATGAGTSVSHTYSSGGSQTVTATVTDNHGNEVRLSTTVNVLTVPVDQTAPTIAGTAVPSDVLTESHGSWNGAPTSYSYQWERCDVLGSSCSAIAGATAGTYSVATGDVSHTIRVQETASNANGPGAPATSAPTAVVVSSAPAATSAPAIGGTARQGQTLIEQRASWSNYPTSYAVQWLRCDASGGSCSAVSGATGQSYLLQAADVAHTIKVQETATNAMGSQTSTSVATLAVLPLAPASTAAPGITGTARQGQVLTEAAASWSGEPTVVSYQWQDCDASGANCSPAAGATGQSYVLGAGDVGHTIRVSEAATNWGGTGAAVLSAPTEVVLPLAPSNTAAPAITGDAIQGAALTEVNGTWAHGVSGLAYQWARCQPSGADCALIPGATGQTYTLTDADVDRTIRVLEIASNPGGTGAQVASAPTSVVDPSPARVKAALTAVAVARWRVRLTTLLRTGRTSYAFAVPSGGRLTITVSEGRAVLGRGSTTVGQARQGALKVTLTAPGRARLAAQTGRRTLLVTVGFAPAGGGRTTLQHRFRVVVGG